MITRFCGKKVLGIIDTNTKSESTSRQNGSIKKRTGTVKVINVSYPVSYYHEMKVFVGMELFLSEAFFIRQLYVPYLPCSGKVLYEIK